ncbi:aminotransferase class I/II-fold pyridoxal phosphate-dependent enzyme [Amycolatopsis sp. Hca4]|uniref:aminotransferase class I/II-fold pyridoxal phosphate-dependent enzyme n=1 Tax=Amycolatopsis sp. Hca4 TaxID=2742131 RepID=UPI00159195E6|nr:aminotransferase class I/II-fold pyridoxal phosphate-dependent enzyme [Amycolatopsis sp. Hca4]QKV74073.1 aminotransferase class I/II-fold pyridoxal phosphate-dependent enzyme [Amycolatopsis sp. Hca4]
MSGLYLEAAHRQGGDLRGLAGDGLLDLSTCVNLFGPAPSARRALDELDLSQLRAHPFGAESAFQDAYAGHLRVDPELLVVGRGITEFIRVLARLIPRDRIAVVTPDYTDSIRHVAHHLPPAAGEVDTVEARLRRVADGLARYDYVVLSNPNNPLGLHIPVADLAEVCRRRPGSTLVVDEAYVDFLDGARSSMASAGLANVVVLSSPNKVLGVAGARAGAMWTPNDRLRRTVADERLNWPLSFIDAAVVIAALRDTSWIRRTRARLLANAEVLQRLLDRRFGGVVGGVPVHYRFVVSDEPERHYEDLVRAGVVVRLFGAGEAGRVPGLRIAAPADEDLTRLAEALAA